MTSSTPHPTPNPRRDLTPAQEAFREALPDGAFDTLWDEFYAAYSEFQDKVPGWRAFFTDHHQSALDNSLRVLAGMLDLPARDAQIRADERRKIDKEIRRYAAQLRDTGAGTPAIVAEDVAGRVAAAGESPAAASVVPAEGSAHPQPATVPYDGPTYTVGGPGFVRPPGWVPAEELAEMDGASDV